MADLIYTCVAGDYTGYADLFEATSCRAYPGADVVVERLPDSYKDTPYAAACFRYLADLSKYDRVYITDVDMIHLLCCGDLFAHHESICAERQSCYSNTVRRKEVMGADRMTGLHFATREWYARTERAREDQLRRLIFGEIGKSRFDDELMLKRIVEDSGLPVLHLGGSLIKRHFGIHIGTVRCYKYHGRTAVRQQLQMRVTPEQASEWLEIEESMSRLVTAPALVAEIRQLTDFCKSRSKQR